MPLQNRVKALRLGRGWSQAELAQRAGISRAAVSAIEIERLVPSVAAALALAEAFGCRVDALFSLNGAREWSRFGPGRPSPNRAATGTPKSAAGRSSIPSRRTGWG